MASSFQIKKIHSLINKLGIDDEIYREMLETYGVKSSVDLNFEQAKTLLEGLENKACELGLWVKQPLKYSSLNRDEKMATPKQLRCIESIWREICYINNDKFSRKSLRKILRRNYKIDDILFLTKSKARMVVSGLRSMKKNVQKKCAAARDITN